MTLGVLPRLSDVGTIVCLAPGPSLTTEDVNYVRGKAVAIAINDAIRLAPWADAFHSSDAIWWRKHYREMRSFTGLKTRVCPSMHRLSMKVRPGRCEECQQALVRTGNDRYKPCWCDGIVTLRNAGYAGLSLQPRTIVTTHNSGGAAINVAVLLGAKRILLLGYDMGPDDRGRRYFHNTEPAVVTSPYDKFRKLIATMVQPLNDAGIAVINCSRRSRLECFPCQSLREALPEVAVAA